VLYNGVAGQLFRLDEGAAWRSAGETGYRPRVCPSNPRATNPYLNAYVYAIYAAYHANMPYQLETMYGEDAGFMREMYTSLDCLPEETAPSMTSRHYKEACARREDIKMLISQDADTERHVPTVTNKTLRAAAAFALDWIAVNAALVVMSHTGNMPRPHQGGARTRKGSRAEHVSLFTVPLYALCGINTGHEIAYSTNNVSVMGRVVTLVGMSTFAYGLLSDDNEDMECEQTLAV
jgi:hypothetical protein